MNIKANIRQFAYRSSVEVETFSFYFAYQEDHPIHNCFADIMKIIAATFKRPSNTFIAEIQAYCKMLIKARDIRRIYTLFDLQKLIRTKALAMSKERLCTTIEFIECEVHSYMTFEVFNLIYDNDTIVISIIARKTAFETAFNNYDMLRTATVPVR